MYFHGASKTEALWYFVAQSCKEIRLHIDVGVMPGKQDLL